MKHWHEKYPFRFGIIFMLVYGVLDVADARWFIPRLARNTCEGCQWIITSTPSEPKKSITKVPAKTSPYTFSTPTIKREVN